MSQSNNNTKPNRQKNSSALEERIMRISKRENYSIISNSLLTDKRLSWAARGLMAYLMTKPNNWEVRQSDLIAQSPAGRVVIERCIKELKELGYIHQDRVRDSDGRYKTITFVYEESSPPLSIIHSGKPVSLVSTEKVSTESIESRLN